MSNLKHQRRAIQILLVKIIVHEFNDNILPAFSIQWSGAGTGARPGLPLDVRTRMNTKYLLY